MNGKDHGHDRTAPSRKGAALTCVGTSVKQAARATPLMVGPYEGTIPRLASRQTGRQGANLAHDTVHLKAFILFDRSLALAAAAKRLLDLF